MGGRAFAASLSPDSFPRMPPRVYAALKTRLLPLLLTLYRHVDVPREMPEKTSHGDLDFIVADPLNKAEDSVSVNIPHEVVQKALGAQHVKAMEGNRTSNFAVPISEGEWSTSGHGEEEENARRTVVGRCIFYQGDIKVCADKAEFDRIIFFHSYGDLGMIMGLIVRNAGLRLGEKGLWMSNSPNPPIELSKSFDDITMFMGWSMERWKVGFETKTEAFQWAVSTPLFKPEKFRTHGHGLTKVKSDRMMYVEFVQWVSETMNTASPVSKDKASSKGDEFRKRVLTYFGKTGTVDVRVQEHSGKGFQKQVWNGKSVNNWTGLGGNWRGVKSIMDNVRERIGGDDGVRKLYEMEGEDGVKRVVLEVKEQLSLPSSTEQLKD